MGTSCQLSATSLIASTRLLCYIGVRDSAVFAFAKNACRLDNSMARQGKMALLMILAGILSALLTLLSYRASIECGLPFGWSEVKDDEALPTYFVRGRDQLQSRYTWVFAVIAGIGGTAFFALCSRTTGVFSSVGCAGLMWPAFVMPLVGWLGMFAPFLIWLAVPFPAAVLVRAASGRIRLPDLLSLLLYAFLLDCIGAFGADWESVFGD